jgi:hypothetical protein
MFVALKQTHLKQNVLVAMRFHGIRTIQKTLKKLRAHNLILKEFNYSNVSLFRLCLAGNELSIRKSNSVQIFSSSPVSGHFYSLA